MLLTFINSDEVSITSLILFAVLLASCVWMGWFLYKALKSKQQRLPRPEGEEFDGIREGNAATPYGLHIVMGALIVFTVWYMAFGYPINHSHSADWYAKETQEAQASLDEKFKDADHPTLVNMGESVFNANCVICHGIDAKGLNTVAANLVQYGTVEHIVYVIKNGSKGLRKVTPFMVPQWDALGKTEEEKTTAAYNVAAYVLSLDPARKAVVPAKGDAAKGKQVYLQVCAACHSPDGSGKGPTGDIANFASNLTTYGTPAYTEEIITNGKAGYIGVMPSFKEVGNLSPIQMKAVALYVESLRTSSN